MGQVEGVIWPIVTEKVDRFYLSRGKIHLSSSLQGSCLDIIVSTEDNWIEEGTDERLRWTLPHSYRFVTVQILLRKCILIPPFDALLLQQ